MVQDDILWWWDEYKRTGIMPICSDDRHMEKYNPDNPFNLSDDAKDYVERKHQEWLQSKRSKYVV